MYIKVKAVPDARNEKVEVCKEDELRIWVKVSAERNMANMRITELLRERFPGTSVRLVHGHHSPSKIFSIN